MRNVTIYSTIGNDMKQVMISSTAWGDLQQELLGKSIMVSGMKAVIGESQVTLESPQAVLPEGDFTLFLMPQKVKSGGWSHEDDEDEEEAFNVPRKPASVENVKAKILYIGEELNELYTMVSNLPANGDPAVTALQTKAEQIKKNFGLFD